MAREDEITIRGAAALLGVHPNTVSNWMKLGLIEYRVLPTGMRRPKLSSVEKLLEQERQRS